MPCVKVGFRTLKFLDLFLSRFVSPSTTNYEYSPRMLKRHAIESGAALQSDLEPPSHIGDESYKTPVGICLGSQPTLSAPKPFPLVGEYHDNLPCFPDGPICC